MRLPWALALLVAAAACGGPPNDCTFATRCTGEVLEVCTPAKDGSPVITQSNCAQASATCVVQGGLKPAICVPVCDTSFVTHCEGNLLVGCDFSSGPGLLSGADCSAVFLGHCDPFYGCPVGGQCVDLGGGNADCQPIY